LYKLLIVFNDEYAERHKFSKDITIKIPLNLVQLYS